MPSGLVGQVLRLKTPDFSPASVADVAASAVASEVILVFIFIATAAMLSWDLIGCCPAWEIMGFCLAYNYL